MNLQERRVRVEIPLPRLQRITELARARNGKEATFGAMTYGGKLGELTAHLIGIIGEEMVAAYFGLAVDEAIFTNHGDNGVDLSQVPAFGRIGVKTTTYWDKPYLRVEEEHLSPAVDHYLLCYVNPDLARKEFVIIGWASLIEVVFAPRKQFLIGSASRPGPMNAVLEEHQLHGIKELP